VFRITQIKSSIGCIKKIKENLRSLGLGKINSFTEIEDLNVHLGKIKKVNHLILVNKIEKKPKKVVEKKEKTIKKKGLKNAWVK